MSRINEEIARLIPRPCFERPFVCDGRPEDCNVVVIGEHPATPMEMDWWTFWDDARGFDLARFQDHYAERRKALGERPLSNTRLRLNRLRVLGLRCLETNAYRNETRAASGLGASNADLLRLFLGDLPVLHAVIAHGKVAHQFLDTVGVSDHVRVHRTRHFRTESYATLEEIARQVLAD